MTQIALTLKHASMATPPNVTSVIDHHDFREENYLILGKV